MKYGWGLDFGWQKGENNKEGGRGRLGGVERVERVELDEKSGYWFLINFYIGREKGKMRQPN